MTEPMHRDRLTAIETAINSPAGLTPDDARDLLAEALRARADADAQYTEADYWRESYRLVKGLSDDEINAMMAVRDAVKAHPRPCWFPHKPCLCAEEPETECERGECLGIHQGVDGYRDCDGKPI